ncbi:hypothetical protein NX722_28520 [Endozoicomonas gorgoniicola]|uniref:Uncharacterized protein n=1 Tax=Endozoicomonas gorgoniicola TaxID=1234144 RepID=A0ABT3N4F5_9GAMM|nr:hypothetical protein [Endozoicomonas gorgoniicola]MCW7556512.1 hypothetical protein [Endozoicomonas gorgoniicola]
MNDPAVRVSSPEYRYLTENSKGFQLACAGAGLDPFATSSLMKTHLTSQKNFLAFKARYRSKHQTEAA